VWMLRSGRWLLCRSGRSTTLNVAGADAWFTYDDALAYLTVQRRKLNLDDSWRPVSTATLLSEVVDRLLEVQW
jgi:hypothetical protein